MNYTKPQLHASALGKNCMEAFRRQYIENEKIPSGIALIIGTGTHKSVEVNLKHKIDTGELLPSDAVQDVARDEINAEFVEREIKLTPEEAFHGFDNVRGQAIDKAVRLARLHHAEKAPSINPVEVERSWSLEIPGKPFDLVGTIDIQEPDAIRDTKTTGKSPQLDAAAKSPQLKAYALAVKVLDGTAPAKVTLDYLVDIKTPKAVSLDYAPGNDDFQAVMARIDIIDRAIKAGVFMPVEPTHWYCNPKWCGYHATCRYVAQPKQFSSYTRTEGGQL